MGKEQRGTLYIKKVIGRLGRLSMSGGVVVVGVAFVLSGSFFLLHINNVW